MTDNDDTRVRQAEEPTVRQLLDDPDTYREALDPTTLAELQRWFGLPSAMELPVEPEPQSDLSPRRRAAINNVDPGLLKYVQRVADRLPEMVEIPNLDLHMDEAMTTGPEQFSAAGRLGEPPPYDLPNDIEFSLREVVPQALLRDLHRPEQYFDLYLERSETAEVILDVHANVVSAFAYREQERHLPQWQAELPLSIAERTTAIHAVPWATLSRAERAARSSTSDEEPST
jgi:hypothetical protein